MFTLFVASGRTSSSGLLGAYEQASLMYMRFNARRWQSALNFQDAISRNPSANLA